MSSTDYFTKSGAEVLVDEPEQSNTNTDDIKKYKRNLKSGESVLVRIPSLTDFVEYKSHGGYFLSKNHQIYNSACLAHINGDDPFDKAVKELYKDLNQLEDVKEKHNYKPEGHDQLSKLIYDLKAKPKILFGFFTLESGDEIVIEFTRKQGKALASQIQEYGESVYTVPFKLSKMGEKTETTVMLTPVMNITSLNETQKSHFEATAGQVFNQELFSKVLYTKSDEQMIQDLTKIGFDVTRIGFEVPEVDPIKTDEEVKEAANDLPF
ncbi:hypothetical protein SAMN05444392_102334 [Seinonella peptonophila]|uniref:Uncharacterized protein n=1 Tax=Seinonella peptonophila TaxID=112248 RepID=A0A1M4VFC6_9BACL|nr:hypothetical protein [Seinonella peptonophila]SHE67661.1 hypothetical protein SAMN05444392_102334 [Seinonella peptonophila]